MSPLLTAMALLVAVCGPRRSSRPLPLRRLPDARWSLEELHEQIDMKLLPAWRSRISNQDAPTAMRRELAGDRLRAAEIQFGSTGAACLEQGDTRTSTPVSSAVEYSSELSTEGDRAARPSGPQTITNEISRRNEMTLQFGGRASRFDFKRNNDARSIN